MKRDFSFREGIKWGNPGHKTWGQEETDLLSFTVLHSLPAGIEHNPPKPAATDEKAGTSPEGGR